jgi:formylglycine-generating enzyme required for sulfatase activity
MDPCPPEVQLKRLLAEALPAGERLALEAHVEGCRLCQQALERLTGDSRIHPAEPAATAARLGLLPLAEAGHGHTTPYTPGDGSLAPHDPDGANELLLASLAPSSEPGSLGRLGDYEVLAIVGRGGMGIVLKAFDPLLRRVVAIKVLAPHLAGSGAARQRFLREAQAGAAVVHEHVVAIHAVSPGPPPYLVMHFVGGVTLEQRLREAGALEVKEVLRIGMQAASGLAAAHKQGLIHRDIKPGNILLENGVQRVKITDFGLARAIDEASLTQSGTIAGTPLFMSPEQARGEYLDPRSDLFSLGSVLYAMCTGRPPFRADSAMAVLKRVCEDSPRHVREINPDVPGWLADVVHKLLAKDPAERFGSAAEVADLLAGHLAGVQHPTLSTVAAGAVQRGAPPAPRSQAVQTSPGPAASSVQEAAEQPLRPPGGRTRRRWPLAVALVGLLAAAALTLLAFPPLLHRLLGRPRHDVPIRRQPPPGSMTPTFVNRFGMEFVRVPKGRAWLGGGGGTEGAELFEMPYDFYLGKHEVTQGQWQAVTGTIPSHFSRSGNGSEAVRDVSDERLARFPVESVSGRDMLMFFLLLNKADPEPGWQYALPLMQEWEYACRGGPMKEPTEGAFSFYLRRPSNQLRPDQANFTQAAGLGRPCPVGSYAPNRLGLHDMHGNVQEWCEADEPSPHGKPSPVVRGGGWSSTSRGCQAASIEVVPPIISRDCLGLRVARVHVGQGE